MFRDWRYLMVFAAVAALALILFGGFRSEPPVAQGGQQQAPRYTLKTVEWTRLDLQGQPQFVAAIDSVDVFDDESAQMTSVELNTTADDKHSPWRLTSPSGSAPPHERKLLLNGPVVAEGAWPDGEPLHFTTGELWVEPDLKQLHTDKPIEITGPLRQGKSKGLRANWGVQDLHLDGNVEMRYVTPRR